MKVKCLLLIVLPISLCSADPQSVKDSETGLLGYFKAGPDPDDIKDLLSQLLEPNKMATAYKFVAQERAAQELFPKIERIRNDEDLSNSGRSEGSTALASVAGIVDAISVAIENGAFTQATNGTASTIRVKPIAIYDMFGRRDLLPCKQYLVLVSPGDGCGTLSDRLFKGFSASVSLDNTKSSTLDAQPQAAVDKANKTTAISAADGNVVSFLTQNRTITSWGIRYEIYNRRDARSPVFLLAWKRALDQSGVVTKGDELASAVNKVLQAFPDCTLDEGTDLKKAGAAYNQEEREDYCRWQTVTGDRLTAARRDWETLRKVWQEQLEAWAALKVVAKSKEVQDYEKARTAFISEENKQLKAELEKPIVSFEYTNLRPLNQPEMSNIALLISKPFSVPNVTSMGSDQEGMFSFNVGVNLYTTVPVGARVGHLRNVQAALQWDIPVGNLNTRGAALFTLAAYYQYQIESGLITIGPGDLTPNTAIQLPSDAKTLLTPKGGMFIAQAKLTLKVADGKAKVPIAISWANRTELIKASEVRGHIGFEFDWDSLLGRTQ